MTKNLAAPGTEILEAALHGLEAERDKLDEQIAQVRVLLGHKGSSKALTNKRVSHHLGKGMAGKGSKATSVSVEGTKRVLSVDARRRIAAAQKKRWAAFRKKQKLSA